MITRHDLGIYNMKTLVRDRITPSVHVPINTNRTPRSAKKNKNNDILQEQILSSTISFDAHLHKAIICIFHAHETYSFGS
jgi:hypothetical protein